jgi:DNA mismatch repair protein MutS
VLGDELCSGTETRSATAIVSAGIQTLVRRGAQFLFATHLHEISEIEAIREMRQIKFAHLGVECNPITKQIIYNRNLEPGAGKSLYGLEVCYGLDMDPEFLELANTCRTQNSSRYNSAVSIRRCEVCKSTKDLESHHILHQVTANKGFVDDGIKTHAASNLTVLCDLCHKQHHSGKLEITGWRDTSEGRELCWKRIESSPASSISNDIGKDKYDMVKERLAVIMAKGKKERELLQIIASEFSIDVTISEIRSWKKQILGRSI